jgi:hypothetical protein
LRNSGVRDVVELVWETIRLRRLRVDYLKTSEWQGLEQLLAPAFGFEAIELFRKLRVRDAQAMRTVEAKLLEAGLGYEHAAAQTFILKLNQMERLDRMIANTEARRHLVLRELDRHRAAVAARLRAAVEGIEDAEFSEVSSEQDQDMAA